LRLRISETREWSVVKIPRELDRQIEEFLKTDTAKEQLLRSKSHVATQAIKEFLAKFKIEKKPRFEHINVYRNRVTILDRELEGRGRIVDGVFVRKNEHEKVVYPYCTYCGTNDCVHTDYAFEIPQVREILEKAGIRKRMKGLEIQEID